MPLTLSNTNNIDSTYQPVIAEIKRSVEHNTLIDRLVTQEPIPAGSDQVRIPYSGRMTAGPLQEGVPYATPRTFSIRTRTVSASEKGVMSVFSRIAERRTRTSLKRLIGNLHGDAMVRLRDQDGFDTFPGFSKSYGDTTSSINFMALVKAKTDITRARSQHFGGRMPDEMPIAVFETGVIDVLLQTTVGIGNPAGTSNVWTSALPTSDELANMAAKMWWRGDLKLANVRVYEGRNIKVNDVSNSSANAVGACFVKSALAIGSEGSIMTNQQYDLDLRADKMESHAHWAYAELIDSRGTKITSQCQVFDAVT